MLENVKDLASRSFLACVGHTTKFVQYVLFKSNTYYFSFSFERNCDNKKQDNSLPDKIYFQLNDFLICKIKNRLFI
jgi:hypothetical protein